MFLRLTLLSASTAALVVAGAHAWEDGEVVEQVQLGDIWSDLNVTVDTDATEVWGTSVATGNTASSMAKSGDVALMANQTHDSATAANTTVAGDATIEGLVMTTTTAYANSASAGSWMGNTRVLNEQAANGPAEATTSLRLNRTGPITSSTTAAANVSVQSGEFGDNKGFQRQSATGSVTAKTSASISATSGTATFATTATGNAQTAEGLSTNMVIGAVQSTAQGAQIRGRTDVAIGSATDVIAATTTAGNSASANNAFGPASLGRKGSELFQLNRSAVDADTTVSLDDWSGDTIASAYGVGNSALVANVGSDTSLYAIQSNYGAVTANASLSGGRNDGTGTINATAIGNASTATLCNACGDATVGGSVNQFNAGPTTAQAAYSASGGAVHGSASAIGNTATFQTTGHD